MQFIKHQSPLFQFSAFMGIFLGFYLISFFVITMLSGNLPSLNELTPELATVEVIRSYKINQLISALMMFVVPAFLFNYLADSKPWQFAGFHKRIAPFSFLVVLIILMASLPIVEVVGRWNEGIHWGGMQKMVEETEDLYKKAMGLLLRMNGPTDLLINLFLMAFVPAFAEEFFFRGTLQKIFLRWWKSPAAAVIGSALFFALMHGTFGKIIPIFLMGILLGVIFHVTQQLWYPIIFHAVFNGLQIVLLYAQGTQEANESSYFSPWMAAVGLVIIILSVFWLNTKKNSINGIKHSNA